MLKNRLRVVRDVTDKLTALEAAIDDALICAGDLTVTVASGRQKANLSAVVAQDAIGLTGDAIQSLHAARAKMVEAHGAFADARNQMGLRTYAGGNFWKPPHADAANEPVVGIEDRKEEAA
ncbi:hypothetical protein GCM10009096_04700 [Parasphingorhabdus litoris]|uniref:Uncharacterized protein n=2 Tax=Parasphingorhabdus litoris TaxID=394733 RepID=A0ABP3JYC3_9SPHN